MTEFNRDKVIELLKEQVLTVTFRKKDGTMRDMVCTLQPDMLPKQEIKEGHFSRPINLDVIKVFDLEAKAWRSFRVDSIKTYSVES
jgi:hypothetical protein